MVAEKCKSFRGRVAAPMLIVAISAVVAGCEGRMGGLASSNLETSSTAPVSIKETAELGRRWQKNQGDTRLGLAYAGQLKALGQTEQQLQVLKTLTASHPGDQQLLAIYGKQLAEAGKSAKAADALEKAIAAGNSDWRTYSALGSVLDQQGKYPDARSKYEQALRLAPDQITVLNNLGMSYALEGDLAKAEATLRHANKLPASKGEPRIRQNLALVVGLQGRFDEARQITSQDLPPDQVEANMAYLKKMLSQPNTWQQLQQTSPGQG
jgi:Flp pilus assembly protein TadD